MKSRFCFTVLLICFTISFAATAQIVEIPDTELRDVIEVTLDKNAGAPITAAEMATLTELNAFGGDISDLTGLEFATNLTLLGLEYNKISDISALAGLTNLTALWLTGNTISDVSAVTELTNLRQLYLRKNAISDVTPVAGLINLAWLLLGRNKISGDNQNGASLAPLAHPFVIEVQDENGSALLGVSVTFTVVSGDGTLSVTSTLTDTIGRAQSTLTLGPHLGTNTVEVSAAGIESPATFYAIADAESPRIEADVNSDGIVNILDLVLVASVFGNAVQNLVGDVNRDLVVNILDLVLVANMFD